MKRLDVSQVLVGFDGKCLTDPLGRPQFAEGADPATAEPTNKLTLQICLREMLGGPPDELKRAEQHEAFKLGMTIGMANDSVVMDQPAYDVLKKVVDQERKVPNFFAPIVIAEQIREMVNKAQEYVDHTAAPVNRIANASQEVNGELAKT